MVGSFFRLGFEFEKEDGATAADDVEGFIVHVKSRISQSIRGSRFDEEAVYHRLPDSAATGFANPVAQEVKKESHR